MKIRMDDNKTDKILATRMVSYCNIHAILMSHSQHLTPAMMLITSDSV